MKDQAPFNLNKHHDFYWLTSKSQFHGKLNQKKLKKTDHFFTNFSEIFTIQKNSNDLKKKMSLEKIINKDFMNSEFQLLFVRNMKWYEKAVYVMLQSIYWKLLARM